MGFYVALWVGKLLFILCRLAKKGGSSLPGKVALCIHPPILSRLSQQTSWGSIVISGTNGKTTTAWLLSNMLNASGLRVVHNRSGANLVYGIASTFIAHSSLRGCIEADVNILECDEAALDRIAESVEPRVAIVTNFFRDQLDRFGELEHTVKLVGKGLRWTRPDGFVVLNADDPLVVSVAEGASGTSLFYGVEDMAAGSDRASDAAEARWCRSCGSPYHYEVFYLAHLGVFSCPQCGQARPEPDLRLTGRKARGAGGAQLAFSYRGEEFEAQFPIPGLYNAYNALAAAGGALAMGIHPQTITAALGDSQASFGRMERVEVDGRQVVVALIKNPAGCNEVLRTMLEDEGRLNLFIAINDRLADGTDVSWLWDADFELLVEARGRMDYCLTGGRRALDMAVRLKYAGIEAGSIQWEDDLARGLRGALEAVPSGQTLYILPTYTAMLELRRLLNQAGYGRRFWEV